MSGKVALRQALRALSAHKLRTFFMMVGIIVGISALTVIVSFGERTRRDFMGRFRTMVGTMDTVIVRPGATATRGMPTLSDVQATLKLEDAQAVLREVPLVKRVSPAQNAGGVEAKYGAANTQTSVFGVTPDWTLVRNETLAEGSFFAEEDLASLQRKAVIGKDVVDKLFGAEDPLGKTLKLNGISFEVSGVMKPRGAGPGGGSLDNVVMIPLTTFSRRLFNQDHLTMVVAQLKDPSDAERATAQIRALLRERHGLAATASDDFSINSPKATMERLASMETRFTNFLALVAAASLLVGGIVIMNLMLSAVSERRREIGIRRSVGAKKRDIERQFLIESVTVTLLGGVCGAVVAVVLAVLLFRMARLPLLVSWQALVVSFVSCLLIGVVFGLIPARRAAALDPVAALKE